MKGEKQLTKKGGLGRETGQESRGETKIAR